MLADHGSDPTPNLADIVDPTWPVLICVLGPFRILKAGQPVVVRSGGKTETLLASLALDGNQGTPRAALLRSLWPDSDATLASHALDTLVYSTHKLLGEAIHAAPVVHAGGSYRLNAEAGVGVDVASFDAFVRAGDQHARAGDHAAAALLYRRAVHVYRGDLCAGVDLHALVERERLRGLYLTLLAQLGDYAYAAGDYTLCLEHALRLLAHDPCREDAHRLAMRCYVRRGERAQALQQYRLCEHVLRAGFDARPEVATVALFDQVRLAPESV
jgi:DNA-binding SARP family transcriptional activator